MCIGRFFIGAGRESYFIQLDKMLTSWFKGKELAFAFSLPLGIARATAAANSYISPRLIPYGLYFPMLIGTYVCIFSLITGVFYVFLETKVLNKEKKMGKKIKRTNKVSFREIKTFPKKYFIAIACSCILYGSFHPFYNIGNKFLMAKFMINEE